VVVAGVKERVLCRPMSTNAACIPADVRHDTLRRSRRSTVMVPLEVEVG